MDDDVDIEGGDVVANGNDSPAPMESAAAAALDDDVFGGLSDDDDEQDDEHESESDKNGQKDDENIEAASSASRSIFDTTGLSESDEEFGGPSGTHANSSQSGATEKPAPEVEVKRPKVELDLSESLQPVGKDEAEAGDNLFYVALPRFLFIEQKPFDPSTYDDTKEQSEEQASNTIRWRTRNESKQSNTNLVRWNDGSLGIFIGKSYFEVKENTLQRPMHLAASFPYTPTTVKVPTDDGDERTERRDVTVEEDYGPMRTQLTFQPRGQSLIELRKHMTEIYGAQSKQQVESLQIISTKEDPRLMKEKLEQEERQRERAEKRLDSARRSHRDSLRSSMTAAGLQGRDEDEDDRGGQRMRKPRRPRYSSGQQVPQDESDSDEEREITERILKAKRGDGLPVREQIDDEMKDFIVEDEEENDDDEDAEAEEEEEEDEEEEEKVVRSPKKRAVAAAAAAAKDADEETGIHRRKRRHAVADDDD